MMIRCEANYSTCFYPREFRNTKLDRVTGFKKVYGFVGNSIRAKIGKFIGVTRGLHFSLIHNRKFWNNRKAYLITRREIYERLKKPFGYCTFMLPGVMNVAIIFKIKPATRKTGM